MEPVWLDFKAAATHAGLSVNTLRIYIGKPPRPLPVRKIGGRLLVHREELDAWLTSFPHVGSNEETDQLVTDLLSSLHADLQKPQAKNR